MKFTNDTTFTLSATDLADHLSCKHLTELKWEAYRPNTGFVLPSYFRWLGYTSAGCSAAEPASVSPNIRN